ncbi:MAPEG family protein [Marinomonas epiphytica]
MVFAMFGMVLLTFAVGLCAIVARVKSVKSGDIKVRSFKLMDGDFPEKVVATTRCFNNQFEVPVLFYAGSLGYLALGLEQTITPVALAWLFVIARAIHAFIHVTYNHLLHRVIAFWASFLIVMALWLHLISSIIG